MKRRNLLAGAALASVLPRPSIAQAAAARTLRFIPEGNLANPDPIWTTTTVARNHGFMIYDTLFGVDAKLTPKPQMCQGYELSDDKLTWTFRLRDGLRFHDGTPVRGADCIASISRWSKRDGFGQRLAAQLDGMSTPDDRSFTVRLKRPFPLLVSAGERRMPSRRRCGMRRPMCRSAVLSASRDAGHCHRRAGQPVPDPLEREEGMMPARTR